MASSYLEQPRRSEAEVRELIRAKIRSQDEYNSLWLADTSKMDEEQKIDHEIKVMAAREKLSSAIRATL